MTGNKNNTIEKVTATAENKNITIDPYESLRNGIIIRAVKDYRRCLKQLKKDKTNENSLRMKADCELFFNSNYYYELTDLDGQMLMNLIKKECDFCD